MKKQYPTIQIIVTEEEKQLLKEEADKSGTTPSGLGKLFITTALNERNEARKARHLVDMGYCDDLEDAIRVIQVVKGKYDV